MNTGFLNVTASLTGRLWVGPGTGIDRAAEHLAQQTGQARALCQVLARLGVTPEAVASFLDPKLRDLLPDPKTLRDIEPAAARLVAAVHERQRIAIFADYDVDGGSSAALLIDWLGQLGHGATLYVPDRIDEGYGPTSLP